jgi:hypothetical protein
MMKIKVLRLVYIRVVIGNLRKEERTGVRIAGGVS